MGTKTRIRQKITIISPVFSFFPHFILFEVKALLKQKPGNNLDFIRDSLFVCYTANLRAWWELFEHGGLQTITILVKFLSKFPSEM
jgi:hypothetical protein